MSGLEWAPLRSTKGAIKLHTLLDLRNAIPAFIHISEVKLHEVNVLDFLPAEAGVCCAKHCGYVDSIPRSTVENICDASASRMPPRPYAVLPHQEHRFPR